MSIQEILKEGRYEKASEQYGITAKRSHDHVKLPRISSYHTLQNSYGGIRYMEFSISIADVGHPIPQNVLGVPHVIGKTPKKAWKNDIVWLQKHRDQIHKQYSGKWIAVRGGEVVFSSDVRKEVCEVAKKRRPL